MKSFLACLTAFLLFGALYATAASTIRIFGMGKPSARQHTRNAWMLNGRHAPRRRPQPSLLTVR